MSPGVGRRVTVPVRPQRLLSGALRVAGRCLTFKGTFLAGPEGKGWTLWRRHLVKPGAPPGPVPHTQTGPASPRAGPTALTDGFVPRPLAGRFTPGAE